MTQLVTYYETLQISRTASPSIIKAAYKTLSQKYHPDKNLDSLDVANGNMKRLNEAYTVLSDPNRRIVYDAAIRDKEQELDGQAHRTATQNAKHGYSVPPHPREGTRQYGGTANHSNETSRRERQEGKSRFEHKRSGSQSAHTEQWTPDQKPKVNIFTAFFVGFAEGVRGKQSGVTTGTPPPKKHKRATLTFWHCVAFCLVGAWILARDTAGRLKTGHLDMPVHKLMFDPGFLGMMASSLIALLAAATIGSIAAALFTRARGLAASFGFAFAVALFALLLVGGEISDTEHRVLSSSASQGIALPTTSSPTPNQATSNSSQQPTLSSSAYDQAIREIEMRHPQLNPDLPAFDRELTQAVLDRFRAYVASGMQNVPAIRRAVADADASGWLRSPRPAALPTAITNDSTTPRSTLWPRPTDSQVKRICEYKGVMTDDDYIACGIIPPR